MRSKGRAGRSLGHSPRPRFPSPAAQPTCPADSSCAFTASLSLQQICSLKPNPVGSSTHTHTHIHIYSHTYTYTHLHIHTHTHIHTYTYTCTHTYTYTHTQIHTYTHKMHTHTHRHTQPLRRHTSSTGFQENLGVFYLPIKRPWQVLPPGSGSPREGLGTQDGEPPRTAGGGGAGGRPSPLGGQAEGWPSVIGRGLRATWRPHLQTCPAWVSQPLALGGHTKMAFTVGP